MTPPHSAGAGPLTAQDKVIQFLSDLSTATEYKSHPLGYEDSLDRHWKEDAAELLAELTALNARLAAAPTGQPDASEERTEAQADLLAYLMSTPPPSWDYDEVMKMVKAATGQEAEHALQSMDASLRKLEKAVGVAPVPQDLARLEARLEEAKWWWHTINEVNKTGHEIFTRQTKHIADLEAELTLLRAQQAKETK